MLLDGVLASPDLTWLTTEAEKRQYLTAQAATPDDAQRPDMPATAPPTVAAGAFVSHCPIGVHASGRAVLVYLATVPWTDEFRAFVITLATDLHKAIRPHVFPAPVAVVVPSAPSSQAGAAQLLHRAEQAIDKLPAK